MKEFWIGFCASFLLSLAPLGYGVDILFSIPAANSLLNAIVLRDMNNLRGDITGLAEKKYKLKGV
jgi:hypothetical protein